MGFTSLLTAPFIKWSAAVVVSAGLVVTPAVVLNQSKQTVAQAAETIEKKQAAAEAKVRLAADEAKDDAANAKAKVRAKAAKAAEAALEEASTGVSAAKTGVSSAAAAARSAAGGVSVSPGGSVPGTSVPAIPNQGVTVPAAPSGIPGLPEYSSGSYNVVVPGTASISKRLCLSGTVNKCKTVTTSALNPINLTVNYSGNTSTPAPTFTPGLCSGGVVLTVGGLETGATLQASVTSGTTTATLSLSVAEMGVTQSASLCDA